MYFGLKERCKGVTCYLEDRFEFKANIEAGVEHSSHPFVWNKEAAGGFNLHLPRGWHGNFQLCPAAALLLVEL